LWREDGRLRLEVLSLPLPVLPLPVVGEDGDEVCVGDVAV
jgi:hypothetical protein